jgi:AraC-like DNA-binding protein
MIECNLKPVEDLVFRSELVLLAEFHCTPDDPLFRTSGPANAHCVVFPMSCTRITRGGKSFVENPLAVSLYGLGDEYSRDVVSEEGTHTAWFTLDEDLLSSVTRGTGRQPGRGSSLPFAAAQLIADPDVIVQQRRLFRFAKQSPGDPLAIEEEVLTLAARLFNSREAEPLPHDRHCRTVVDRTIEYLGGHYLESMSLVSVAREVGAAPTYVSRLFRRVVGCTMHAFREELRLRRSLDLLPESKGDVIRVAVDLGFSSHSHFTNRFHRRFGLTPTQFIRSSASDRVMSAGKQNAPRWESRFDSTRR